MVSRPISQDKLDEVFQGGIIMELILFIYMLVIIVITGHILLVREKDVDTADVDTADVDAADVDAADAARLVEWAEDVHMPAAPAVPAVSVPVHAADDLLPGEEEDHWEDLADFWEFPEIGKKQSPVIMTGDCKYNRALRGCGRRGKGKQKGGKHIDKKRLRRADTKAHLSLS